jgi:hypothetical protein
MEKQKRMWLSKEQKYAHLAAWQESKLSKREYCKREQISYGTFLHWMEQRNKRKSGKRNTESFIPLEVSAHELAKDTFATISIGVGHKIELHHTVSAKFINELLLSCK